MQRQPRNFSLKFTGDWRDYLSVFIWVSANFRRLPFVFSVNAGSVVNLWIINQRGKKHFFVGYLLFGVFHSKTNCILVANLAAQFNSEFKLNLTSISFLKVRNQSILSLIFLSPQIFAHAVGRLAKMERSWVLIAGLEAIELLGGSLIRASQTEIEGMTQPLPSPPASPTPFQPLFPFLSQLPQREEGNSEAWTL